MMTTKDAATIWRMSIRTVVERCKEGMIPLATQEGRKWRIPKKSIKPILTRHQACVHFQYIESIQSGANPKVSEAGFFFLADVGFITELGKNGSSIQKLLKDVKLTALGKELIEKENEERRKQGKTEIVLKIKVLPMSRTILIKQGEAEDKA